MNKSDNKSDNFGQFLYLLKYMLYFSIPGIGQIIAFTTMAYCHVNRDLEMYDKLFNKLISNHKLLIVDMVVNGVDEILPLFNKTLANRVINYVENDTNKKIIK